MIYRDQSLRQKISNSLSKKLQIIIQENKMESITTGQPELIFCMIDDEILELFVIRRHPDFTSARNSESLLC